MPAGWDNNCEDKIYWNPALEDLHYDELDLQYPYEDENGRYSLKTKPEVLHAESNAIGKLARSVVDGKGADLFVTLSPCIECAKLIHQTGIKRVFYREQYRNNEGIEFLRKCNIEVNQI